MTFVLAGVLTVGTLTGFAYANTTSSTTKTTGNEISQLKVEENFEQKEKKDIYKDMIKIMKDNGYKDISKAMQKNDYEVMDDFMNNMTDEDYENMIKIMRESDYGYMADMMESIDREEMIEMHNSMGGSESCHGTGSASSGMMGGF